MIMLGIEIKLYNIIILENYDSKLFRVPKYLL